MSTYYYKGELYHHGIAGQKWGVQNGPPYPLDSGVSKSNAKRKFDTGKITGKVKSAASSVKNKISSIGKSKNKDANANKKKVSEMSDQELKKAVDRLNLENQYYTLSGKVSSATESKGHKFVSQFMNKATSSVIDSATSAIGSKVKNYLNNALDVDGSKAKQAAKEAKEAEAKRASDATKKAAQKAEKKASKAQAKAEANDVKDGKYRTIGGDSKQSTDNSTKTNTSNAYSTSNHKKTESSSSYDYYTRTAASTKASSNVASWYNESTHGQAYLNGMSAIAKQAGSSSNSSTKLSDCTAIVPYGEDYVKKHSK